MRKVLSVVAYFALVATSASANMTVCKGCHGDNFEKQALGKSKVVKDMTKEEIAKALKGFKEGTYGGAMKGIMQRQTEKYSDEELEEMAEAIKR